MSTARNMSTTTHKRNLFAELAEGFEAMANERMNQSILSQVAHRCLHHAIYTWCDKHLIDFDHVQNLIASQPNPLLGLDKK